MQFSLKEAPYFAELNIHCNGRNLGAMNTTYLQIVVRKLGYSGEECCQFSSDDGEFGEGHD